MVLFIHFAIYIIFVPFDYYLHVKSLTLYLHNLCYLLCGRRNEIF